MWTGTVSVTGEMILVRRNKCFTIYNWPTSAFTPGKGWSSIDLPLLIATAEFLHFLQSGKKTLNRLPPVDNESSANVVVCLAAGSCHL